MYELPTLLGQGNSKWTLRREGGSGGGGGWVGAKRPVDIKWGKSEWPKWFW